MKRTVLFFLLPGIFWQRETPLTVAREEQGERRERSELGRFIFL